MSYWCLLNWHRAKKGKIPHDRTSVLTGSRMDVQGPWYLHTIHIQLNTVPDFLPFLYRIRWKREDETATVTLDAPRSFCFFRLLRLHFCLNCINLAILFLNSGINRSTFLLADNIWINGTCKTAAGKSRLNVTSLCGLLNEYLKDSYLLTLRYWKVTDKEAISRLSMTIFHT